MASSVHFEIFKRQGAGGWSLVDVRERRDDALTFAQELETTGAVGVKVVKETYNDTTGDYLSLKIYEHGEKKMKSKPAQEDIPASPCFRVDDLYSYHARKTIASLLSDFLAHNKVTVTEFGHRADLLEKLEATGTVLQHAIQRVAVAQASSGENQLPKIIRSLHELATQASHRVYRDTEKGRFATCQPGEFVALAARLASDSDGRYLLNGAIAIYLKDTKTWCDKVEKLIALMEEAQEETPGAALLLAAVDSTISEILSCSAGLRELIDAKNHHGEAVMSLVKLFLGRKPDQTEGRDSLVALTREFAQDTLPNARVAIAHRIVAEIRSFKRLCPHSLEDEFKTLRQIANLMVTGVGKYLGHEDLVHAFVLRSQRLITNECLAPYLSGETPDVKLERILFVEENIIGAENKRHLEAFVTPIITGVQFEEYFQSPALPLVQRLARLEALRDRFCRSGFQENQKSEIADALDKTAVSVETKGRLFESIDKRNASPAEKAFTLIKLLASRSLTSPRLTGKAREMVIGYLAKPGFLTGYAAQISQNGAAPSRDTMVADLIHTLERAGITPQTGLKNIAA
jgi:hypothetical protein